MEEDYDEYIERYNANSDIPYHDPNKEHSQVKWYWCILVLLLFFGTPISWLFPLIAILVLMVRTISLVFKSLNDD